MAASERVFLRGMSSATRHYNPYDDARIARVPTRHEFTTGDTLYVPQNTVAQHFSADGQPLRLLSGQSRLFKQIGYDNVAHLDDAAEQG